MASLDLLQVEQSPSESTSSARLVWAPGVHVPCLDGLRGLAILMVTIYRFGKEGFANNNQEGFFLRVLEIGETGVDLFFVLSGFLITGILLDSRSSPKFFSRFYQRRSLRIFPLYFVSLAIFLFFVPFLLGSTDLYALAYQNQVYLWTYLTNVKLSLANDWCFGYLDHFWSLAVEEHFYLFWPLIVYFCAAGRLLATCFFLAIASAGSRIIFAYLSDNDAAPHVFTFFRCDGLLLGASIAIILRHPDWIPAIRSWCVGIFPVFLMASLALVLSERGVYSIKFSIFAVAYATGLTLLATSQRESRLAKFFESLSLRMLGKYSYAMYIFQSPIIPLLAAFSFSIDGLMAMGVNRYGAAAIYTSTMFALTVLLAVVSWNLLEKHCLKLRR